MKLPWYRDREKVKLGDSTLTIVRCRYCSMPYIEGQRCKICRGINSFTRPVKRSAGGSTRGNGESPA